MNKLLLYTRVSENSRVHYASSSFWTCPFSDRTQWQVESGHRSCRSVFYMHCNASLLYFTSLCSKVEQTCNKAIKICAVELTPKDSGTLLTAPHESEALGMYCSMCYINLRCRRIQLNTFHCSVSPHTTITTVTTQSVCSSPECSWYHLPVLVT